VPDERMLVIYDDIDLPPGKVRVRKNGGPGTHNGMRSIAEQLGETNFPRIRVGTGDRPAGQDLAAWVLGHYEPEEKAVMEEAFAHAAEAALIWVNEGIDKAMQKGNS
jgi:PTH1 family peptidyl-tRNA hydrolase